MSADKVQDAVRELFRAHREHVGFVEAANEFELSVRADEREAVERRIADALMTAERGEALVDVVKGAHRAELELAALERDDA